MEKSFTHQDIDRFFNNFRNLSNEYNLEKVHQLLNNPNARARYKVKLNHKPFNFIIMTGVIIAGLSALLYWSSPQEANSDELYSFKKPGMITKVAIASDPASGTTTALNKLKIEPKAVKPKLIVKKNNINPLTIVPVIEPKAYDTIKKYDPESCAWTPDTIIDKSLLMLELSDKELSAIGIARNGDAFFYHNIIEGQYDLSLTSHPEWIPEEERITTFNKFFVAYVTNSQFEPEGSGKFYSSMDTLIPVSMHDNAGLILWFTPNESIFSLLPDRYNYLKSTCTNLICLKKKYPQRTFTNYLENGVERVLDPINVLNLNKEDLQKIGVKIDSEGVIFQTINKKYTLKIGKHGTYSAGNDEDSNVFPPNPYPVLMTDTLGRRLYIEGSISNIDTVSKIMNILVPVRMNLNEFVSQNQETIICWYYPTQEFLNALPEKTGKELKSELLYIRDDAKAKSPFCNYFEVCKSSLKLDNFKLYPNPASYSVSIEFENPEEVIGSISIINMAGLKLRQLLPDIRFSAGHNYYQMNLSGISPGIYLISVNTKRGFKTQRLIVSR
jgi:hypothetical protein